MELTEATEAIELADAIDAMLFTDATDATPRMESIDNVPKMEAMETTLQSLILGTRRSGHMPRLKEVLATTERWGGRLGSSNVSKASAVGSARKVWTTASSCVAMCLGLFLCD